MATPPPAAWFGPADLENACEPAIDWACVQQELALTSRKGRVIDACPLNEDGSEFRVSLAMRRPLPTEGCPDSDTTVVWRGAHEWYYEVMYRTDSLPEELADLELCENGFRQEELQISGQKHSCFVFSRGYDLTSGTQQWDDVQRRQWLIDMECSAMKAKLVHTRSCAVEVATPVEEMCCHRTSLVECAQMLSGQPGAVVYVGSGASAGKISLGNTLDRVLGVDKHSVVDDVTRRILQRGDEGVRHVAGMLTEHLLEPLVSAEPTAAHVAVAALAISRRWPVVTTNSDVLLEHAGVSPARLYSYTQVEERLSSHSLQHRPVLICVGVGADHKSIIGRFRELRPDGVVLACIQGKAVPYLRSTDWLLDGDVQVTLPGLVDVMRTCWPADERRPW